MGKVKFEKINTLSSRRIQHPNYRGCLTLLEELYEEADELARMSTGQGERGGAHLFTAETGVGKTTLLSDFLEEHPAHIKETNMGKQWCVPVALVRVPPACTLKGYIFEICRILKVTTTRDNTTSLLTRKAIDGLKNSGARMLVTDETNIIVESASLKETMHIRNFIKQLIDEAGIPVVFFGLPAKCNEFFQSDGQTASRIVRTRHLNEFDAPSASGSVMHKVTERYLKYLSDDCSVAISNDLDSLEFSQRLYLATTGVMRDIQKFMVESAKYAMRKNKVTLSVDDLKQICGSLGLDRGNDPFGANSKALRALMAKLVAKKRAA